MVLELVVILIAVVLGCGLLGRRLGLPVPVLLLSAGVLLGFVPSLRAVHLPPELMLLVFLPALLYWESLTTSLREIRANFRGIALTSTLLVVVTAGAVATTAHALGLPWGPAWVLGAAVAPTDATAVSALARLLPHRNVTILRAESLVNDGTALVLYGVAVGVTVGEERLTVAHVGWLFVLSYGGGLLVGAATAFLGALARKRLDDPLLGNALILLIPFAAFLVADLIGSSGVLAVVVCGLIMSQLGPRIGQAHIRQQTFAFWSLATFLLNAGLFVLVGLETQAAVRNLVSTDLLTAVLGVAIVVAVIVVVRIAFLVATAYTLRLVDRRPEQRARRVSNRARIVSTVAGFRGAVSLAAALAIPTELGSGQAFPDRDLIVFVTAGVVAVTLVVQGLLLRPTVLWARLPTDDREQEERQLAQRVMVEQALAALEPTARSLGTDAMITDRLRSEYEERLDVLQARHEEDDTHRTVELAQQDTALRRALLRKKREGVIGLRDKREIDDTVLREIQGQLDIEELRLNHGDERAGA